MVVMGVGVGAMKMRDLKEAFSGLKNLAMSFFSVGEPASFARWKRPGKRVSRHVGIYRERECVCVCVERDGGVVRN